MASDRLIGMISPLRSFHTHVTGWLLGIACLLFTLQPAIAWSDDAPDTAAAADDDEGDPVPAGDADADADPDADTKDEDPPSVLEWVIETSGWIGAVLLAMSIYFVAKVVMLFMELREDNIVPRALMQQWDELLAKRDYQGIYKLAKEDSSEVAQLVAAGMAALPRGLADARDTVERDGEEIVVGMEKKISMLAVIGSLGPMIGLLGTLKGMIASFSVIALSETQLKPSEVAGGISEALLITFEGVALSVPAIFFFAYFRNIISTLSLQAINAADELIRRVHSTGQSRSAAAAPASASPQAPITG